MGKQGSFRACLVIAYAARVGDDGEVYGEISWERSSTFT